MADRPVRAFERRQELAPIFEDRSFFETLRLEPYYGYTATQVPAAASFLTNLIDETLSRRLEDVERRYRSQFTTLDTLISNLTATSNFLTQQLDKLPDPTQQ